MTESVQPSPADLPRLSEEADRILRAMRRIVRAVTIHSKRLFRQTGLTLPQILCLRAIDAAGDEPVTAADIARQVQLSPATITGILDRLERGGMLLRERDSRDRRKVYLSLTTRGQQWLTSLPLSLQDRVVQRLDDLTEKERQVLVSSLEQLVDIIDASSLDASPLLVPGEDARAAAEE
jgi:DNA-binding MarR family transcriptional regulator